MTTIKSLVLIAAAYFMTACGGPARDPNTAADIRAEAMSDEDTPMLKKIAASTNTTTTSTVATQRPTQRTSRVMVRSSGAQFISAPAQMPAPYITSPRMVYGGPDNSTVNFGVAVLDMNTKDCDGACARFYISADTMPEMVRKSSAAALFIDGFPVPISYYGTRTPSVMGDSLKADGSTKPERFYAAPLKRWNESLRWHIPDTGEHMAKICFYFKGANDYYGLIDCTSWMVSIERSNYAVQYGMRGK